VPCKHGSIHGLARCSQSPLSLEEKAAQTSWVAGFLFSKSEKHPKIFSLNDAQCAELLANSVEKKGPINFNVVEAAQGRSAITLGAI
jgi:hypothetical protein